MRTSLFAVLVTVGLSTSCAPDRPPAPRAPVAVRPPPAAPSASASVTTPPLPLPLPSVEEARARGEALRKPWSGRASFREPGSAPRFFEAQHLDEAAVRGLLEGLTQTCLAAANEDADACKHYGVLPAERDDVAEALLEMAGEIADTSPGPSATMKLLVKLEARGAWRAKMAIERVLERRLLAASPPCAPPTTAEIDASRAALTGVQVRPPGGAARAPTEAELADLAYLRAAVGGAGPEVGTTKEDESSPALAEGAPEAKRRESLRSAIHAALLDGDVARHAAAAEAYVTALGWPGPLRVAEDQDPRWGGPGFSYVLRDWARSAEILGRYELAESLRRRAAPGGGMCGTSTPSVRADQIEGVIRAGELRAGCRGVVAERLFAVSLDLHHAYGPERLADAGFDVARLYRAALLDASDGAPWTARLRAIAGYADVAGRDAVPRLVELAEKGPASRRIEAIDVLGRLLTGYGLDPCKPSNVGFGRGSGMGERDVRTIMADCKTKLDDKALTAVVGRVAALARDPDPAVREAVARALGLMASPRGRPALEQLLRDRFDATGQVCSSTNGGPQVCEPNMPVKRAAREALEALAKAEQVRREQLRDLPR